MMEELNRTLFLWVNATPQSAAWSLELATFIAKDLIAIVPLLIAALWLWGPHPGTRALVLKTGVALLCALTISWSIGQLFPHPRPFVMGFGHQYLSHSPTESYPSNHGTIIFTFALAFIFWHRVWSGALLLSIGIAIAWSRIYLGVHWPLDMLGGLLVGMMGCLFSQMIWPWYGASLMQRLHKIYRLLFSLPIRKGWVRN